MEQISHKIDYKRKGLKTNVKTTIRSALFCCATCANWSGQTEYQFPGIVYYDPDCNKGICNSTFLGAQTEAHQCCSNWEQRYRNH